MTYSVDFRLQVLRIREQEKLSIKAIAHRFGVGAASVTRWLKSVEPRRTRYRAAVTVDRIALARDVRLYPDAYHYERAARLGCSKQGICHALKRMNISNKKTLKAPKSKRT